MPVPKPEELRGFIDDSLGEKLRVMEKVERRRSRRSRTVAVFLLLVLVPAALVSVIVVGVDTTGAETDYSGLYEYPLLMLLIFLAIFLPFRLWVYSRPRPFEYKEAVVGPLIHYVDPRLVYRPKQFVPQADFEKSGIGQTPIQKYGGSDFASGKLGDMKIQFSEVEAKSTIRSGLRRIPSFTFQGLFLSAELPRTFDGFTMVIPRTDEPGIWDPRLSPVEDLEEVEWEEDSWNAHFRVFSTSPEECRRILSPSLRERIKGAAQIWSEEAKNASEESFYLSFVGGAVYIAVPQAGLFEQGSALHLSDTTKLHRAARVLCEAVDLVESAAKSL